MAEAERWLFHAERDLGFGKLALEIGGFYAQVCFMAQQSAEKALKALLYLRGARLVPGTIHIGVAAASRRMSILACPGTKTWPAG